MNGRKRLIDDPDDERYGQEIEDPSDTGTPEEFAEELFGVADKPIEGMPSIQWLQEQFKTKSAIIRYLVSRGFNINQIAKHTGIKYQQVRNVATNPLKRGPNESWVPRDERTNNEQPLVPRITHKKDGL